MDHNIRAKHLGLVSVVVALMLRPGVSTTEVNGSLGSNITLKFTFKTQNYSFSHFGLYYGEEQKFADCRITNNRTKCSTGFDINSVNDSILYHITNLSHHHSKIYYASILNGDGRIPKSNMVRLVVREDNRTSTVPPVPPEPTHSSVASVASRGLSVAVVTGIVVCPLLLLAAALPCVLWCLLRTRETKAQTQDRSISTVQARVEASQSQLPAASLVYSVLDFPQRSSAVLDIDNDTMYATISYVPEKNQV